MNRLLDACPDAEWRLIIVLSRFSGLRCPSEILPLTWADIDFERGLINVKSCNTEGYEGKDRRIVPMFPEVREALMEVFEQADEGTEFVIVKHRLSGGNYRTQMLRIIARAGLKAWPKPFHNMRSSRQTELSAKFPVQSVCAWLGNSATIAMNHYLQVLPEHVTSAVAWTTTANTSASAPSPSAATAGVVREPAAKGPTAASGLAERDPGQRGANGANVAAQRTNCPCASRDSNDLKAIDSPCSARQCARTGASRATQNPTLGARRATQIAAQQAAAPSRTISQLSRTTL